jgi:hypothetical protein
MIRSVKIAKSKIAENLSASHFIGPKALAGEKDRLIDQLRQCFRYQDHTREEFERAIALLRPVYPSLKWGNVPHMQHLTILFYNPTESPITFTGMIAGDRIFQVP